MSRQGLYSLSAKHASHYPYTQHAICKNLIRKVMIKSCQTTENKHISGRPPPSIPRPGCWFLDPLLFFPSSFCKERRLPVRSPVTILYFSRKNINSTDCNRVQECGGRMREGADWDRCAFGNQLAGKLLFESSRICSWGQECGTQLTATCAQVSLFWRSVRRKETN